MSQPDPGAAGIGVGVASEHRAALDDYVAALVDSLRVASLNGLHVIVDCGNGAAFRAAPTALRSLGAQVDVLNAAPDGVNINAECGSTAPGALCDAVVAAGADVGLAFDGDADRVDRGRRAGGARRRRRDARGRGARPPRPQSPARAMPSWPR